jgi:hypothetical protein
MKVTSITRRHALEKTRPALIGRGVRLRGVHDVALQNSINCHIYEETAWLLHTLIPPVAMIEFHALSALQDGKRIRVRATRHAAELSAKFPSEPPGPWLSQSRPPSSRS